MRDPEKRRASWRAHYYRNKERLNKERTERAKQPLDRYRQHKYNATNRGHEFNLTFEEWWAIWEPRWDERGPGADHLCMCRIGDEGAYEVGNVYLDTVANNSRDRWCN